MLYLTDGRVVDLSTNRAKFHALKHQGPAPDAVHRVLYKLVDVIYRRRDENGRPGYGWTEHDYDYSGYTLADIHKANDWTTEDIAALFRWAAQDSQKIRIETCRRRLIEQQTLLSIKRYSAPQFLFSRLQQCLQALPLQRASVKQWQATISNINGIRSEEITWSGLEALFKKLQPDTILTKQELFSSIDFGPVKLQLSAEKIWDTNGGLSFREVVQRMPHQAVYRATLKLDDACQCLLRYIDDTYHYRVGVVKTSTCDHPLALNRFWFAFDAYGRAIPDAASNSLFYPDSESAKQAADNYARAHQKLKGGNKFHTRYDHLTLFGGNNYREWIVSLPHYQRIFFGGHYFDHNVLAHIRTTTRCDTENRKLLFIEEVQSDWHQCGQTQGYDTSYWGKVANAPFKKEWASLATKLILIHASQNGFDGVAWPDGNIQETRYTKVLPAIKRHYDREIPEALNRLGNPFNCGVGRTTIKTRDPWLNLVRSNNKWRVIDGTGKFETREKYDSREQAMMVLCCHCKTIDLPVSVFVLNDELRKQIAENGLPLFGESF